MRADKLICISVIALLSLCLDARASDFKKIQDSATGISVSLPLDILTLETQGSVGKNWSTVDRHFNVSAILFSSEQTLESAYQKLSTIKGRKLIKSDRDRDSFLLVGHDANGSSFSVKARRRGTELRGVSIVFEDQDRAKFEPLVQPILDSFDAFPSDLKSKADSVSLNGAAPDNAKVQASGKAAGLPIAVLSDIGELDDWDSGDILVSADKATIAIQNSNGVKLWDVKSGRWLRQLEYQAFFTSIAFSPDSRILASSHKDGTIKLWDVSTGENIKTYALAKRGEEFPIADPIFLGREGAHLYSADDFGSIYVWDVKSDQRRSFNFDRSEQEYWPHILALQITSDGQRLIAVGKEMVKIFDASTGKELRSLKMKAGYTLAADSIAGDDGLFVRKTESGCSIDEVWFISFGEARDPILVDKPERCDQPKTKGPSGEESTDTSFGTPSLSFNPKEGRVLLWRKGSPAARIWNVRTRAQDRILGEWANKPGDIVAVSSDWTIGVVDDHSRKSVQTLEGRVLIGELKQFESSAGSALAALDGRTFLVDQESDGDREASVWLWRVNQLNPTKLKLQEGKGLTVHDLSTDAGLILATSDKASNIYLFSIASGLRVKAIPVTGADSIDVARISPKGGVALMLGTKGKNDFAAIVNVEDGLVTNLLTSSSDDSLTAAAFSRDGSKFAVAHRTGLVEVWNTDPLRKVKVIPAPKDGDSYPLSLVFSGDSQYLFGGTRDSGLFIWSLATGKQIGTLDTSQLAGHVNLTSVVVSHDGRLIAGGLVERARSSGDIGSERGVKVWDLKTKKLLYTLRGHEGGVPAVAFSPDDRWIVSGSYDGTIRYWDRKDGRWLATFASVEDGRWLFVTKDGLFAGAPGAEDLVHVVRGQETFGVNQFQQQLFRSDLVRDFLSGDPERNYANAVTSLNLESILNGGSAPQIEALPEKPIERIGNSVRVTLRVVDTGGGIGSQFDFTVNRVAAGVSEDPRQVVIERGSGYVIISEIVKIDATKRNVVEVTAYNGRGLLATQPFRIVMDASGIAANLKARPRLFVIAIGVSKYVRDEWRLTYAADDAAAFARRIKLVATPLYENINVQVLPDGMATRQGIADAFANIKKDVLATDIFMLFVAGHGRTVQQTGSYYFLPQDLTFDGGHTIEDGIGPALWTSLLKQIAAQTSILIFDTCESAAAVGLTRGSKETESAIERLRKATGRSIITAARQAAYEGYHDHGVLTYSILEALSDRPDSTGEVDLQQLSTYVYKEVPKISLSLFGISQEPHNLIEGNFPIGITRGISLDSGNNIPVTHTHFVLKSGRLRERPEDGAPGDRILPLGYNVRIVEMLPGGWALIARDGQKIGYFRIDDLGENL